MVRLKDISDRAGVSVMTVSKALRNARDVSASTKARIQQLAREMGYVPDSSAQGLRTRTSRLIGLLIPTPADPVHARILLAIEEHAHQLGYDLLLTHSMGSVEREELCIRRLLSRRVDGLLLSPVYRIDPEARIYQELLALRTAVVLLGPPAPFCNAFPSVQVNDLAASEAVTRHLLELGHTRIAFLSGPLAAPWSQLRFDGYRRALREAGSDVDDRLVFQAGESVEDGSRAALQMIQESCDATAVQAVSDLVAIGAASTLLDQGVRIPHDLSVAGFGNILSAEHFRVPLTTVRQPKFRLGAAAIETLSRVIRGEHTESKRLQADLVVRASTAAPRPPA